ncbi:hypothetical protein [Halalkalibacter hemicellulosilyticus]|uniref:Uncharacterized protein n=1 Tax=Halalkalibacter hemicellulosilyticusJCM 9152 TaxID=1236971 RepID=W4QL92_9BACI|nr:hypothetical protein [Halalkalibacter hemicellulosilyticus]GAE32856.1 hypothetical protein JCM9152_4443 [Halalkalibacter hemicellulosilyticusJCM 9152]
MGEFVSSYFFKNYGATEEKFVKLSDELSIHKVLTALDYTKRNNIIEKLESYANGGTDEYSNFELVLMFLLENEIESIVAKLARTDELEDECERIYVNLSEYIEFDYHNFKNLTVYVKKKISEPIIEDIKDICERLDVGFINKSE